MGCVYAPANDAPWRGLRRKIPGAAMCVWYSDRALCKSPDLGMDLEVCFFLRAASTIALIIVDLKRLL